MSNLQDKLMHFNEVILKDAVDQRDRMLAQTKAHIEDRISRERAKFQQQADEQLKKEISNAVNEKNNRISKAMMDGKLHLIKMREEILDTVLLSTKQKIVEFVSSEEYDSYLMELIKESCDMAGEGELMVYVTPKDLERFKNSFEQLKKELPKTISFATAEQSILGACQIVNLTKGLVVNNTLSEKLEAAMSHFFEKSDLAIPIGN